MPSDCLAERDFGVADQERFARVSGDVNPMHMDAVVARRTLAGFPVVHGMHTVLWSLDCVARAFPQMEPVASIAVVFSKVVYVGDHVRLVVVRHDKGRLFVSALVETMTVMELKISFARRAFANDTSPDNPVTRPTAPVPLGFDEMGRQKGRIPFGATLCADVETMFPAASRLLGARRVASLACASYLVGMVCPGLHSIFGGLTVFATPVGDGEQDVLDFNVTDSDIRFRLITMAIAGGGWVGSVNAHARPEPAPQAGLATIATKVAPGEFGDVSMLVVGGSRGLGEVVAKIGAAGGAHVILTYAVGRADAQRVQDEIVAHGGRCDIIRYDVRSEAGDQLSALTTVPNEIYYMATPTIAKRTAALFSRARLDELLSFYVDGFDRLVSEVKAISKDRYAVFYPSSVYVEDRPAGMTEYAMAKAAGEVLCADLQSSERSGAIVMRRLPRMATDQTASIFEVEQVDPADLMLPAVRAVHAHRIGAVQKP